MYLVAGGERDGLHGLADAHLIGDQRSAAAAQRKLHALPLEGQEGTRQHGRHASETVIHISVARLLISTPARVAFRGSVLMVLTSPSASAKGRNPSSIFFTMQLEENGLVFC